MKKEHKHFLKVFLIIFKGQFIFILIIIFSFFFNIKNNFFFFEKNEDELNYCKNFGLMVYNYYYGSKLPLENTSNIGDYFQSLAALQFLPKNCKPHLIDRDSISFYNEAKVKLIMAGYHFLTNGTKYVSSQINPIFISYHLQRNKELPPIYIENIKKFSPIGCRDIKTRDKLIKYGINAYFSSCLTTTLDIDYGAKEKERTNEIIFIDYKFGDYPEADEFIYSLKAYNFTNIIYIDHHFKIKLTQYERFKLAKKLLDKYARAKLIISTRLHGALPCLAFNTPVILINKVYDYDRYQGLYELLNTIGINNKNEFDIRVNINKKGYVYNSNKYKEYSTKLKEYLKDI